MQNYSKSTENYCFKHKNLVSFRGFAPDRPPAAPALPLNPRWGLRPQTPL